ncbi:flippase [Halorussus sp. AFM4]|uniref:flippase n=1 Tax=Halorussus sp. AFM4 TaxID=3421651 RepID=UPI003EBAB214
MSETGIRRLLRSGGVNFAGMALRLGLSFVVTLFAARYLGKASYGAVSVGTTILTAVSTLTMLGLGQGIGGFLPRYEATNKRRGILMSAFSIVMPLSITVGVGIALLAEPLATHVFDDKSLVPIIQVCALGIPAANLAQLAISVVRGKKQTLPKVIIDDIALLGSRALLVLVFITFGAGALAIASAYPLSFLISAAIGIHYLVRHTSLFPPVETLTMRTELLSYSLPLWISAGMSIIYSGFDTFILAYFSETAAVGIYKVVYSLSNHVSILLISLGYIVLPTFSELYSKDDVSEMQSYYQSVSSWIFLGTLPPFALFLLFPGTVIKLLFGAEYVSGRIALSVLAFGFFFHSVIGPNAEVLKAVNEPRLVMIDDALSAVVNVALNLILIPRYSYLGAAVATTISYVFLNTAYSYQLYRKTDVHPFSKRYIALAVATILVILFAKGGQILARVGTLI